VSLVFVMLYSFKRFSCTLLVKVLISLSLLRVELKILKRTRVPLFGRQSGGMGVCVQSSLDGVGGPVGERRLMVGGGSV
jgi:hypothetical protein